MFQFAPNDVLPWQYHSKDDMHGIGYQGMKEQDILLASAASTGIYGMSGQVNNTYCFFKYFDCCRLLVLVH